MNGTPTRPVGPVEVEVGITPSQRVSGLLLEPAGARACLVLAHGAGAGMAHSFLVAVADGLAERRVATLRYQFPYMERGSRRPDSPALAQAAVRAAVAAALRLMPGLPLVAGGKSFGGRMTSQAQAASPLPGVRGIAFLGFPLHAAGKPSNERAQHLFDVQVPMLFLQGSSDKLAALDLLEPLVARLCESRAGDGPSAPRRPRAMLKVFRDADHSFHVPRHTGQSDDDVRRELLDALASWILEL